MDSLDSSSSDESFGPDRSRQLTQMDLAPLGAPRNREERLLIEQARQSMFNVMESIFPSMSNTQQAYYASKAREMLNFEFEKFKRKFFRQQIRQERQSHNMPPANNLETSHLGQMREPYGRHPNVMSYIQGQAPIDRRPLTLPPAHLGASGRAVLLKTIEEAQEYCDAELLSPPSTPPAPLKKARENVPIETDQTEEDLSDRPSYSPRPMNSKPQIKKPSAKKQLQPVERQSKSKVENGVVLLTKWRLKRLNDGISVAGMKSDKSQAVSGRVIRLSNPNCNPIIVTANGSYRVEGPALFPNNTPVFLTDACRRGFPRQWKSLCNKWQKSLAARRLSSSSQKEKTKDTSKLQTDSSCSSQTKPSSSSQTKPRSGSQTKPSNSLQTKPSSSSQSKPSNSSRTKPQIVEPPTKVTSKQIQVAGSDTSWDTSSSNSSISSPEENTNAKVTKPAEPMKVKEFKVTNGVLLKQKSNATKNASSQKKATKPKATKGNCHKPSDKKSAITHESRPNQNDPEELKRIIDQLGVQDMLSRSTKSSCLTPGSLLASQMQPDSSTSDRYTTPILAVQHLFLNGTHQNVSPVGSPNSNISTFSSRENPVLKRLRKDVEGNEKKKANAKAPEFSSALSTHQKFKRTTMVTPKISNQVTTMDDSDEYGSDSNLSYSS